MLPQYEADESALTKAQLSQKTDRLYSSEFRITKGEYFAAYTSAGLSYDSTFDLSKTLKLPYNDDYFSVPAHAPHGQNP